MPVKKSFYFLNVFPVNDDSERQTFLTKDYGIKNPCIVKLKNKIEDYNPDDHD